jgi:serine protein kinase
VQRAISADEEAIKSLFGNYIDNVKANIRKERVGISESRKDDFRREIMNYIAALALEGKVFDYKSDARLQKALELKLFEDKKDSIKLTTLITSVVDQETQAKIDAVKTRLIRDYGYCNICATDTLNYVASIFARGDAR